MFWKNFRVGTFFKRNVRKKLSRGLIGCFVKHLLEVHKFSEKVVNFLEIFETFSASCCLSTSVFCWFEQSIVWAAGHCCLTPAAARALFEQGGVVWAAHHSMMMLFLLCAHIVCTMCACCILLVQVLFMLCCVVFLLYVCCLNVVYVCCMLFGCCVHVVSWDVAYDIIWHHMLRMLCLLCAVQQWSAVECNAVECCVVLCCVC